MGWKDLMLIKCSQDRRPSAEFLGIMPGLLVKSTTKDGAVVNCSRLRLSKTRSFQAYKRRFISLGCSRIARRSRSLIAMSVYVWLDRQYRNNLRLTFMFEVAKNL